MLGIPILILPEEQAVSPVIGVILMVAVTVILAAVIGSFVIGMGDQVQTTAPQASFTFSFDAEDGLLITHDGGEPIDDSTNKLQVVHHGEIMAGTDTANDWTATPVTAGVSLSERITTDYSHGDEIRVVWRDSATGHSITIASTTAAYDAPESP